LSESAAPPVGLEPVTLRFRDGGARRYPAVLNTACSRTVITSKRPPSGSDAGWCSTFPVGKTCQLGGASVFGHPRRPERLNDRGGRVKPLQRGAPPRPLGALAPDRRAVAGGRRRAARSGLEAAAAVIDARRVRGRPSPALVVIVLRLRCACRCPRVRRALRGRSLSESAR